MKKITLFFLAIICLSFSAIQTKEEAKEIAATNIVKMKEGMLLVRLYNKHKVIEALEEKGMSKRAETIKNNQIKINKEIINAFTRFNFCEVKFFYSDDSENLIEGDFSKLVLFDDTTFAQRKVELTQNFFVADFGYLPGKDKSRTETNPKKISGIEIQKRYKGGSVSTKIKCMYIRNSELSPLGDPFPLYVRFHPTPLSQLTYQQVVQKMNSQLSSYYESVSQTKTSKIEH